MNTKYLWGAAAAALLLVANLSPLRAGVDSPPVSVPSALGVGSAFLPPNLTSTGTLVSAGMYPAVTNGSANFGPTGGQNSIDLINYCHICRIRQDGAITQVKLALPATTGITGLYLKIWRADNGNFDQVGVSANLAAISGTPLAAGQINTLPASIPGVKEGDYIGWRVEYSGGASAQVLSGSAIPNFANSTADGAIYSVLNATPGMSQYNWLGQTALASTAILTEIDMTAPVGVVIGDSRADGFPTTTSFADPSYQVTDVTADSAFPLFHALGYPFQNMGIGSQTTTQIKNRFAADAVSLHPRVILLQGFGVNNLIQTGSSALSTMESDATAVLNMAQAAGIPMIVVGDMPWRNYSGATTALLATDNTFNAWLQSTIAASYPGDAYVDPYALLGQYSPSDPAGNLDAIQGGFDGGDGLHLNRLGYNWLAQAELSLTAGAPFNGRLALSGMMLKGDVLAYGDSDRFWRMNRSTLTGSPGSGAHFEAGGAAIGSTNQNGGTFELRGGVATGTGYSQISLAVALAGSSGQQDNAPGGLNASSIPGTVLVTGKNGFPQLIVGAAAPSFNTTQLELHGSAATTMSLFGASGTQGSLFQSGSALGLSTTTNTSITISPHSTTVATFTPSGLGIAGTLGLTQATWADNQTCTPGQISVDASYLYECTATNTVKRAALSSF